MATVSWNWPPPAGAHSIAIGIEAMRIARGRLPAETYEKSRGEAATAKALRPGASGAM